MKKPHLSLAIAGLMLASAVVITSCKKKDTTTTPKTYSTTGTSDNSTSENTSKDLNNIGSEAIDNGHLTTYKLAPGAGGSGLLSPMSGTVTVMLDSLSYKFLTVTFNAYTGWDGHTRSGTIKYDWSHSTGGAQYFKDAGFDVQVTAPYNDYKVDGNSVVITKKRVTNIGLVSGCYNWTDSANIKIIKTSGTITWNHTGNMILINTSSVTYNGATVAGVYPTSGGYIDWLHAIIGFTGTASGTTSAGDAYTVNITSRVDYNMNCSPIAVWTYFHPPVAGSLDYIEGGVTYTVNYGSQTCDDTYTVTVGTWSTTISFI